ncbi:MAG: hypothetical protein QOH32_4779 [Bradyrhizobium sp.]|nr:hypothetical protein [Bradyrhizobium sp.]
MSRGMPSMTALLGMLAIAGYQNRDKLADMFRNATSGQPAGAKDSLSGMLGSLGGLAGTGGVGSLLNGGIGELLEHFRQNGQGDAAQSGSIRGRTAKSPRPNSSRLSVRTSFKNWSSRPACRSRRFSTVCPESFRLPWTNTRLMDVFRLHRRDNTTAIEGET